MSRAGDILVEDAWLAGALGRPSFVVAALAPIDGLADALAALPEGAFVTAKVPASDVERSLALQARGMRLVDTALVFEREAREGRADDARVRAAGPDDEEAVAAIAAGAFSATRFHLDPAIGAQAADRVKAAWARAFFAGRRGDAMVVAERAGRVVGFLQLIDAPGPVFVVDLIGVADGERGEGLGEAMVALAQSLRPRARMRAGTQAANPGAVRFYEREGFRFAQATEVLHFHAGGDAS